MAIFALSPLERVLLLNGFFPDQDDVASLQRIQNFKDRISLTDEELDTLKITTDGGVFRQEVMSEPAEFEIGEVLEGKMAAILKRMDEEKKMTIAHMSLWEKFVDKTVPASNGEVKGKKPELTVV